jgi:hypothetical protein
MHFGQRFHTSVTTLLNSAGEISLFLPTTSSSRWRCLFVVADPKNSFPLSVWRIIGALMVQNISYKANAIQDARLATSEID